MSQVEERFGLLAEDVAWMVALLRQYPQVEKAVIFGSRAMGTHEQGSDVDLALCGTAVTLDMVSQIHAQLEELSPMPYFFDVVDYTHLEQEALKAEIDRVGQVVYEK